MPGQHSILKGAAFTSRWSIETFQLLNVRISGVSIKNAKAQVYMATILRQELGR